MLPVLAGVMVLAWLGLGLGLRVRARARTRVRARARARVRAGARARARARVRAKARARARARAGSRVRVSELQLGADLRCVLVQPVAERARRVKPVDHRAGLPRARLSRVSSRPDWFLLVRGGVC